MKSAARCLLATCALCAAPWASGAPAVPDRDSPLVRSILAGPLTDDVDELLTQQALLRVAGEKTKADAVERIAERLLLRRILGEPPVWQRSLEASIADGVTRTELAELRRLVLTTAVTRQAAPPERGERKHAFRNESRVPILAFRSELVPPRSMHTELCNFDGPEPLAAGAVREIDCTDAGSTAPYEADGRHTLTLSSLRFVPAGYQIAAGGEAGFDSHAERALARIKAAAPESLRAAKAPSGPEPYDKVALMMIAAVLAPALLGMLIGVPIGMRSPKPATTVSSVAVVFTALAVVAMLALGLSAPSPGNLGSLGGLLGLAFLGVMGIGALVAVGGLWALVTAGLWIGSLVGAAFRKGRPR